MCLFNTADVEVQLAGAITKPESYVFEILRQVVR